MIKRLNLKQYLLFRILSIVLFLAIFNLNCFAKSKKCPKYEKYKTEILNVFPEDIDNKDIRLFYGLFNKNEQNNVLKFYSKKNCIKILNKQYKRTKSKIDVISSTIIIDEELKFRRKFLIGAYSLELMNNLQKSNWINHYLLTLKLNDEPEEYQNLVHIRCFINGNKSNHFKRLLFKYQNELSELQKSKLKKCYDTVLAKNLKFTKSQNKKFVDLCNKIYNK